MKSRTCSTPASRPAGAGATMRAPASGTRRMVVAGSIYNADTAAVTVTLRYNKVADSSKYIICQTTLGVSDTLLIEREDTIVLASTETLEVLISGAPFSTNPQYRFAYGDAS